MKIQRKFLYSLDISDDAIMRVSLNLDRIETGQSDVLTSPIANERSTEDIFLGWDKIFQSGDKMNDVLMDIELSNRSKYGPRSIAIPWSEREESVKSYFGYSEVGSDLEQEAPILNRLRPLDVKQAISFLKNTTSTGLPYMSKKRSVKAELENINVFNELLARRDPCVLFTRTQEGKKTRTVWGYPVADTLQEMRFYRPVLNIQKRQSWRAALNTPVEIDRAMTNVLNKANSQDAQVLSIDFSSYDQTVKFGLQKSAFSYIKSMFQERYYNEIDEILERFSTIGLITPDGILSGFHGVPSGSTFTNEIDSISQYLVAKICRGINIDACRIQGDDGVYIVTDPVSVVRHFGTLGLEVNEGKSKVSSEYALYLQSLYHNDYRSKEGLVCGIYPTYRALSRIVFLERFDDFSEYGISGKDYFAIRTLSILEN